MMNWVSLLPFTLSTGVPKFHNNVYLCFLHAGGTYLQVYVFVYFCKIISSSVFAILMVLLWCPAIFSSVVATMVPDNHDYDTYILVLHNCQGSRYHMD